MMGIYIYIINIHIYILYIYTYIYHIYYIDVDLPPYLVGGFNHLEKHESQWEELSHIIMENKKCLKPPTMYIYI